MDAVQVAMLTLVALAVGTLIPVLIQLWLTLRQMQQELRDVRALVAPVLDDIRGVTQQLRSNAQLTSVIAVAVSAGVQAWLRTKQESPTENLHNED